MRGQTPKSQDSLINSAKNQRKAHHSSREGFKPVVTPPNGAIQGIHAAIQK